jgi:ATP-dependent Zn protease
MPQEYSEETARLIDAEIHQILEASHARVRETLLAKRALLKALATLLIQHEVVDRNALDRLLATSVPEDEFLNEWGSYAGIGPSGAQH